MHIIVDADYVTCMPFYKGMKMAKKPCAKSLDCNIYTFVFFIIKEKHFFIRINFGTLCLCLKC